MKTILIDGDMVAWNIAYHPQNVASRAVAWVRGVHRDLSADRAIVCFSDPTRSYWRRRFWPAYKTRASDPPSGLAEAKEAMANEFVSRTLDGMEADDVMGILATSEAVEGVKVIVANDKDMLSVPGEVFRPRDKATIHTDEPLADYMHLMQTLTGDSTDGYPGCPGIGPAKAANILSVGSAMADGWQRRAWVGVILAFKAKGLTEADALIQARVSRICRASDFDTASRSVIPWEPPSA